MYYNSKINRAVKSQSIPSLTPSARVNFQVLIMSDTENNTSMDSIVTSLKSLEATDLFKVLKTVVTEVEKKSKQIAKSSGKSTTTKKSGSMPKGEVPPQLKKPRAWVEYTLKDALQNGWESFVVVQTKKDKDSGVKTEEQIEMPGSILHDGAHVFDGSVTTENPTGKQLIHKEAMSLSKQRKESGHATYAAFEAQYVDEVSEDDKSVVSSSSSKVIVKMTAAEKEAEAAAKKAAKEAEKAAKKAEKEAEKAEKKAEKEAEKAAAKAAKEEEKAAAKAAKEAQKKPAVTKAVVPASAVTRPKGAVSTSQSEDVKKTTVTPVKATVTPVKAATEATQKKKPVTKVEEIPADGMVHPWTHKGKKYLRNSDGETWSVGADGGCGEWVGMYDSKTDKIDTTAAEPIFDDSE
jgi:hypothetical protein